MRKYRKLKQKIHFYFSQNFIKGIISFHLLLMGSFQFDRNRIYEIDFL